MRTVIVSSSRSMTIVAKAPVALSGSRRDRKYGRTSSPAAAGRKLRAAKPTAVARKELAKLALPSGSSRNCQRHARITRFNNIVASDSSQPSRVRMHDLTQDAAEVDVPQEQPQQGQRQHDNGDCADM